MGHGILDLLCLDHRDDLVVVELKRTKTPREVTAQALNYGAWAAGLSAEEIQVFGDDYHRDAGGLAETFHQRFDAELPDVLNNDHHLLVVGSAIDDRTERIIRYLSESHGVSINALTFNYFRAGDGRELLARTHLIEPDAVEDRTARKSGSKRRRRVTLEEHREEAERRGVGPLFNRLIDGLERWRRVDPVKSMVTLYLRDRQGYAASFNVVTWQSEASTSLRFNAYKHRIARLFGLTTEEVRARALSRGSTRPLPRWAGGGATASRKADRLGTRFCELGWADEPVCVE